MASDTSLVFNLIARDQVSSQLGHVEGRFGRLKDTVKGFIGPAAALGAVHMLSGFIQDAQESRRISQLTEQALKSTGASAWTTAGQIGDLATSISNKTGADDEAIQSGSNLLLTFTNIRNEAGKGNDVFNQTTQAAVDMAAALNDGQVTAEGVHSASMMLGKALNDPISGMTKLTRSGVSFTEQQKAQVKAMVESGDTLGAQKLILREVGKEFGGAAQAASSPMDKLKTTLGNLGETVGSALLPYVDKFATVLGNVATWMSKHEGLVKVLAIGLGALAVVIGIATAAQMLMNLTLLASPITWIVLGIVLLVGVIIYLATKTRFFQTIWNAVWGFVKGVFNGFVGWVKGKISAIVGFFTGLWAKAKIVWVLIKMRAIEVFAAIGNWIRGKIEAVKGFFGGLWNKIRNVFSNARSNIISNVRAAFDWARGKVNGFVSFMSGLPSRLGRALSGAFNGLKSAFRSAINWIIGRWNRLSFHLPSVTIFGKKLGGGTISTPNIPYLAKGGTATMAGAAIVGEKGPEMLSLPKGAQVNPLPRTGGSAGGGGEIHVHLKLGDKQLGEIIIDPLRKSVASRGGNVQAVLGR